MTSILDRFNKETTGEQNALAIRTLTALGVPPRFTYITFDQLMTAAELRQTYAFQGRTDLLLQPQPQLSVAEIIDGVHDERWVAAHTAGRPFYTGISYLLVGMECLIGAAYTRRAEAAGLTGRADPSMGRVEARYADWRIGVLARRSQLWIDRNFALDYTLKSLEKILSGRPYAMVRDLRRLLKDTAYQLFGTMLDELSRTDPSATDDGGLDARCQDAANALLIQLRSDLAPVVATVTAALPADRRDILRQEHRRWAAAHGWQLINAADPCGT
ncbi:MULTISPECIES: hypothetical protein [unclassified Micromonospora]|uniref:hypothetical protein n=1 Tax=unclassified Micromonospora TaxID=2617518 RepID=UPI0020B25292|nr:MULTISPECIES: hypothetical protein [unclassified Micromonospora]MDM4778729.1 hypothetical protein [Micromonospora sp. b486]